MAPGIVATEAFVEAVESAFELEDLATVGDLLDAVDQLPPVERSHYRQAHQARFRSRLAAAMGDGPLAGRMFKRAAAAFRESSVPFWLAVTLVEQAEWLGDGEAAELAGEARSIFERLGAAPWLQRADRAAARAVEVG
jgi:hypothetical protein